MLQPNIFQWVVLPILIALIRVCDVTIGTIRIIFVSKGNKIISPILGFFEVLIWLIAISQVMQNLSNWVCYVAYAGGFAVGNYIGILLEEKMALGTLLIRVFINEKAKQLAEALYSNNHGVTIVEAEGSQGKVHMLYTIIQRKYLSDVVHEIKLVDPKAFFTVEDVRLAREGIFQTKQRRLASHHQTSRK
ncbi:MAG: DUF2179 domain-containing protein [Caldisericia bacterium]|nr:DUF2179 domain-containing protein [Caldisericia bacterium]